MASLGDLSKLTNLIIFVSFWVTDAFGNMLASILVNSYFGKRPGVRDMLLVSAMVALMIFTGND